MAYVEGVVEKVSEQKSPVGSSKKWVKKGMMVGGKWYNAFLNKDNEDVLNNVTEGAVVKIGLEQKGEYTNVTTVEVLSAKEVVASPSATKAVATASEKDYRITYLASRRDALEFVTKLLPLDILALPTKKADKVDAIVGYVEYYANKFATDAMLAQFNTQENNNNNDSDATTAGVE